MAYKYTGKELDDSTGLYFYEARYYDATLGRFISADTLVPSPGNPQDFNRYTYGNNNPILFNDPTGHFGFKSIKKIFKKASRKLKKTLGSAGFTAFGFGIQIGIVPVPFLSPIQSAILGSGLLTQSKSGRYVLAGEIIVGSAVASWYCGGCAAVKGAAIGSAITGGFGGYSAAQNGGDISKGLLFGAATGAATGALNGWATGWFNFASPDISFGQGAGIFGARIGAGAIAGAAGGSTVGYAGGAGSGNDILHGAFHGAIVGATVAGALTTVDAFGGFAVKVGGDPTTSSDFDFGPMIKFLDAKTVQELTQSPIFSSLAVTGASGYDIFSKGHLTDLAIVKFRNILEKGGELKGSF